MTDEANEERVLELVSANTTAMRGVQASFKKIMSEKRGVPFFRRHTIPKEDGAKTGHLHQLRDYRKSSDRLVAVALKRRIFTDAFQARASGELEAQNGVILDAHRTVVERKDTWLERHSSEARVGRSLLERGISGLIGRF